jgi:hypothetical protein
MLAMAGIAIMLLALFESTPEKVSEWQNFGHYLYVTGATFFIATAMCYNRIDQWLDEKQEETKKST